TSWSPWTAAFVERLRELGWIDGRTIAIEYRWAEGRPERTTEIAAEFVRLKVDAIVTFGTAVPIVKQATTVIPIVFAIVQVLVGGGLVTSLAKPGGKTSMFVGIFPDRTGFLYRHSMNRWRHGGWTAVLQLVRETGRVERLGKRFREGDRYLNR